MIGFALEYTPAAAIHDPVTFAAPPVNEVVLSVQFEQEVIDDVVALSEYRQAIREEFPGLEKQPPLPPAHEDFGHPPQAGMQFEFLQGPPAARYWFISPDGTSLIQVQGDRFVFNWRRVQGNEAYPR